MYYVFVVSQSESATMLDSPLVTLKNLPTDLTEELNRKIVRAMLELNEYEVPANLDTMTHEDLAIFRKDEGLYNSEDTVVIIEGKKHIDAIARVGKALSCDFGSDSCTYAACAAFGITVMELGVAQFDVLMYEDISQD